MSDISNCADFKEKVVLINIGREWHDGLTPEQLYERTRRYWYCNPHNYDAKYAVCTAKGIVRAVYRIDRWERVDLRTEKLDASRLMRTPKPKHLDRWAFHGAPASGMNRYVGARVSHTASMGTRTH